MRTVLHRRVGTVPVDIREQDTEVVVVGMATPVPRRMEEGMVVVLRLRLVGMVVMARLLQGVIRLGISNNSSGSNSLRSRSRKVCLGIYSIISNNSRLSRVCMLVRLRSRLRRSPAWGWDRR